MPLILVEGPKLEIEKKRKMTADLTEAASTAYNLPKETIIVIIKENQPENVSIGGTLIIDRNK